ncbi:MAG: hypothetical protein QW540_11130 [Archaeoglobaceae archaeon]
MGRNITLGKILFAIKAGQNYFNVLKDAVTINPSAYKKAEMELERRGLITANHDRNTRRILITLNDERIDEIDALIDDYINYIEKEFIKFFRTLQKVNAERAEKLLEKLKGDLDAKGN